MENERIRRPLAGKGWLANVWRNMISTSIEDMVKNHGYVCEYDGNSADGWFVYVRKPGEKGIDISPFFGREQGDTLRDLKAAFARAYPSVKLSRGRNHW